MLCVQSSVVAKEFLSVLLASQSPSLASPKQLSPSWVWYGTRELFLSRLVDSRGVRSKNWSAEFGITPESSAGRQYGWHKIARSGSKLCFSNGVRRIMYYLFSFNNLCTGQQHEASGTGMRYEMKLHLSLQRQLAEAVSIYTMGQQKVNHW